MERKWAILTESGTGGETESEVESMVTVLCFSFRLGNQKDSRPRDEGGPLIDVIDSMKLSNDGSECWEIVEYWLAFIIVNYSCLLPERSAQ